MWDALSADWCLYTKPAKTLAATQRKVLKRSGASEEHQNSCADIWVQTTTCICLLAASVCECVHWMNSVLRIRLCATASWVKSGCILSTRGTIMLIRTHNEHSTRFSESMCGCGYGSVLYYLALLVIAALAFVVIAFRPITRNYIAHRFILASHFARKQLLVVRLRFLSRSKSRWNASFCGKVKWQKNTVTARASERKGHM